MAWDLEVLCAKGTRPLDDLLPDVFVPTGDIVGFENATSDARSERLCAATLPGWDVLIDTRNRLSQAVDYLLDVSGDRALCLVRIAALPLAVQLRRGRLLEEIYGALPLARALGSDAVRPELIDGEETAIDYLRERTGLEFPLGAFWSAQYSVYELAVA